MTPDEQALVTELFDRLATLENAPRDPQAESLIRDGLRRAPNAAYSLVQTMLVQDEALKHCLLYTSPSPRDRTRSRMPSSA